MFFYIIVEINLGLQLEPENLDVNKVCFESVLSNWISLPRTKDQDLKPWNTLTYRK